MPYALELALDDTTTTAVRRVWRELEDAGITYIARSGLRPHISLGIWETIDLAAFERELTRLAAETAPLPITLATVGLFPAVAVYLAPTVTAALIASPWRRYAPGVWVPHCTLAVDLAADHFERALEIARRVPLPLAGRLVEVGLVEFRPVKRLVSRALGDR